MAFFSVIIPLYNKENFIEDTIKSVLNQTFQDFEVIIIDDGSTDDSLNIAKSINDKKIQIFTIQNSGVSYARNYGIKKAQANFIAFLDADDIWYSFHLDDLKNLIELHPYCGMYCKAYTMKLNNSIIKPVYKNIPQQINWIGIINDFFESSLINCIAWTSAVAIPKHMFSKSYVFDESITMGAGEDIDLWLRIALNNKVAFHDKTSAVHILHADNRMSKSNANIRQFIDLDNYEHHAKKNKSLKTFLDLNRYSIAIQYKLAGNQLKANTYISKIDKSNLNQKQLFLLGRNRPFLKFMLHIKNYLLKLNINFSSYQ